MNKTYIKKKLSIKSFPQTDAVKWKKIDWFI